MTEAPNIIEPMTDPRLAIGGNKPLHLGHRKRLRERFLAGGVEAIADYELLEMILFPAKPMGDVKPLAKKLLAQFKSFGGVLHADAEDLVKVEGIGEAAVVAIKVAKAAAERLLKEAVLEKPIIKNWQQLIDYCRVQIGHRKTEAFHVLFLNSKLHLIADEQQGEGTINHTPAYPREIVKRALELAASSLILVHNHPTGEVNPSKEDVALTRDIVAAAKTLGINVHDHLIIGASKHFSFKEGGLL